MTASIAAIGQDRNDAPQWFTNNVKVDGTFTTNGPTVTNGTTTQTGNETVNGNSTVNGNVVLGTAGNGLQVKEGTNATMGITAAMTAGTITVNTTAVTANSRIFLTAQSTGAGPGALRVSTITPATSFVITSSSGTDTSTVAWLIVNPAP